MSVYWDYIIVNHGNFGMSVQVYDTQELKCIKFCIAFQLRVDLVSAPNFAFPMPGVNIQVCNWNIQGPSPEEHYYWKGYLVYKEYWNKQQTNIQTFVQSRFTLFFLSYSKND